MKFKFITTISLVAAIHLSAWGQNNEVSWASQIGGAAMDNCNDLGRDMDGNIYVTGGFQETSNFGTRQLRAKGYSDVFIAKFDKNGNTVWASSAGGDERVDASLGEFGKAIAVKNGHLYVVGAFQGNATFQSSTVTSAGSHDIFIAKYSLNGELVWVRNAGGTEQDLVNSVDVDDHGNVFVTGSFQSTAHFGEHVVVTKNVSTFFLAKYNSQGDVIWVKSSPGINLSEGATVNCSGNNCFLTGKFEKELTLDDHHLTTPASAIFIAMVDQSGSTQAVKQITGESISIEDAAFEDGHLYITGSFQNSLNDTHYSNGLSDAYLTIFDNNLKPILTNTFGGPGNDAGKKIAISTKNGIMVAGTFQQNLNWSNTSIISNGGQDIFVASFKKDGSVGACIPYGGVGQDKVNGFVSEEGQAIVAGNFYDEITAPNATLVSTGLSDIFVLKLNIKNATLSSEERIESVSVHPNPANDKVTINASTVIREVKILSVSGHSLIQERNLNTISKEISIKKLPAGLYTLKVQTDDGSSDLKIIVE